MTASVSEFGEFRVQDQDGLGAEFNVRDDKLFVSIEGAGYEGDWGSTFSMSLGDAKALLLYLQEALQVRG